MTDALALTPDGVTTWPHELAANGVDRGIGHASRMSASGKGGRASSREADTDVSPRGVTKDDSLDWALLKDAKTSASSFSELFERHRDYVFRIAWGFAGERHAEDITQEVFVRILRQRRRWTRRAKFTTLLYQVALNTAREVRRGHGREVLVDLSDADAQGPVPPNLLRSEPVGSAAADLAKALASLSNRQREVVVLRHLEGLSTKEAAQVMGCGEGSVKVHLHRGMTALKTFLEAS